MKKVRIKKEEVDDYFCDYCNEEITSRYSSWQCQCCHKDICPKHSKEDPLSDNSGDRVNYVCVDCFEIMKPFVKKIEKIQEESYKQIEKLTDEMIKLCRKNGT